ncbi:hypothetical protein [Psychroserpens jangbogonensis]|uniref:hypothetical protein n=1 Tax=Psychroserpens jangbogonensis TaxID=1484460 RepID=UPI00053EF892|nr:hypothetical protein [Psychroserpens jangbogonensis]
MKKQLSLLLFLSFFMFSGCEDLLDCILNRRPEIHDKTFKDGTIDVYYYQEVTTEIKNEPRDDDYGYNYDIYGDLPDGLQMVVNYRTVSFEGIPEVDGKFTFTLLLYVDPPLNYDHDTDEYEDVMCSESTSKEFTITIN